MKDAIAKKAMETGKGQQQALVRRRRMECFFRVAKSQKSEHVDGEAYHCFLVVGGGQTTAKKPRCAFENPFLRRRCLGAIGTLEYLKVL